jgi:hypothetical protein
MNFGYGNSNNRQNVSWNTNVYASFGDDSMLSLSAWNRNVSIKIRPAVGKNSDGLTQYADNNAQIVNTALTEENTEVVIEGIEKEVLPALKGEKETGSVTVVAGADNYRKMITIGYDGTTAYISVALNISDEGTTNTVIRHNFNTKSYYVDYNPETGSKEEKNVQSDFMNFYHKLLVFRDHLNPVIAHSINYDNMYRNTSGNYNNNYNGNNNNRYGSSSFYNKPYQNQNNGPVFGNNNNANNNSNYSAPESNADSIDDVLPFN